MPVREVYGAAYLWVGDVFPQALSHLLHTPLLPTPVPSIASLEERQHGHQPQQNGEEAAHSAVCVLSVACSQVLNQNAKPYASTHARRSRSVVPR